MYDPLRPRQEPVNRAAGRPQRSLEEQMNPKPPTLAELKAPDRTERFEVVLLDRKVNLGNAMPSDFTRRAVVAPSPYEARAHKDIQAMAETHTIVGIVAGHVLTMEEQQAQRRSQSEAARNNRSIPPVQR